MEGERRWELRRSSGPVARAAYTVIWAGVWVPVEVLLLRWTAGAVATPFGVWPELDAFSHDWTAVSLTTGFAFATLVWTSGGWAVLAAVHRARRGDVVVAGPAGIRTERRTRDGHRVAVDLAWRDVREARLVGSAHTVQILGTGGVTKLSPAGTPAQHREIRAFVNEHVASLPDRPPVLAGSTAYVDDRGATLVESRGWRRNGAVVTGVLTALAGVNAVALALDGAWPGAVPVGLATAGLGYATVRLLRWTPRWIARPGAVVLERRLGAGFAFEARRLELVRIEGEQASHQLVGIAERGRRKRRTLLWAPEDAGPLEDVGRWLAKHAEIPFETRVERSEPS